MADIIAGQRWITVLESSASLAASGSIGASALSMGYARIVGIVFISASTTSGSAIRVYQSADNGQNWDAFQNFNITESSGSFYSASLHGNAVRVDVKNGADGASIFRTVWYMCPLL